MANAEAPGRLDLIRTFVNTVDLEDGKDPLAPDDRLREWCAGSGVCAFIDEEGLTRLREFREGVRAVLEANAGEGDQAVAWRGLEPFAGQSAYVLEVTPAGRPALKPQGAGAQGVIAALLAVAYDASSEGTWQRLKACRKESCRWAFYDRSKNGSGAWCNMAVCGNRVKAQRRRARLKTR